MERLATVSDVSSAASVLAWDRQTYMPEGGVGGRAQQLATLARLAHEMLVSEEVRELLEAAGHGEPGSEQAALLRIIRRDHGRATKLPPRLVEETSYATALAEQAWLRAREESDWSLFAPHLEKVLTLKREQAHYLGDGDHPYDAMLDLYAPGSTTAGLRRMFDELKAGILPLVRGIGAGPGEDREAPLRGEFDEARQEEFARAVVSRFGYDWSRGRQDRAVHPFCINFGGPDDVRITTRVDRNLLPIASVRLLPRGGPRPLRAGRGPRLLAHAARGRRLDGRPRVPVAPVGEPRRPLPSVLVPLLPSAAGHVPRGPERDGARRVSTGPSTP
jgi:carboxypeptidase Taq